MNFRKKLDELEKRDRFSWGDSKQDWQVSLPEKKMGVYRKRWIGLSERNEESHLSSDVLGSRIHPKQGLQTKKALLDDAARSFQLNGAHHCPAFVAFGVLN